MKSYDIVAVDSFRRMADNHNGRGGGGTLQSFWLGLWSEPRNPTSAQNLQCALIKYPFSDLSGKLKTHFRPQKIVHSCNI